MSVDRPIAKTAYALHFLALIALYLAGAVLGSLMATPGSNVSLIWLPAGISVLYALRVGSGLAIAAGLGNFLHSALLVSQPATTGEWLVPLMIGMGTGLQCWFACYFGKSLFETPLLQSRKNLTRFMLIVGPAACLIASTIGILTLMKADIISGDSAMRQWWHWYLGDLIGTLLILPLGLLWGQSIHWISRLLISLPCLLIVVAAFQSCLEIHHNKIEQLRMQLTSKQGDVSQMLDARLLLMQTTLETAALGLRIDARIQRSEFEEIGRFILQRFPFLNGFAWAPTIEPADIPRIEAQIRDDYGLENTVREIGQENLSDTRFLSPIRLLYPVQPRVLGIDLRSEAVRRQTLETSNQTHSSTMGAPLQLVNTRYQALQIFYPVLRNTEGIDQVGHLVIAFPVRKLFSEVLSRVVSDGYRLTVADVTQSGKGIPVIQVAENEFKPSTILSAVVTDFEFGGRRWQISLEAGESLINEAVTYEIALILLLSTLLSISILFLLAAETLKSRERKHQVAEKSQELEISETRYRKIIEALDQIIFQLDETFHYRFVSRAYYQLFDTEDAGNRSLLTDLHPADRDKVEHWLAGPAEASGRLEVRLDTEEDQERWVELIIHCLPLLQNQREYVGVMTDITERKRLDDLRGEFMATVSHELRTPLTAIKGALGMVRGTCAGQLPEQAFEMVELAYRNSERLMAMIMDLLDLQKLDSGTMVYEASVVDLAGICRQKLSEFVETDDGRSVRSVAIRTKIESPAWVYADAKRIAQVLDNLLSNAIKFSPLAYEGEPLPEVTIRLEDVNDHWRVSVVDQGSGIPHSIQSRIFKRFSQGDSSDQRKAGGTGLGLYISRQIIQDLGGRIGFESRHGKGSTFWFELPISEAP